MTLLVMLLTTATAWADTGFNYIGANGAQRNTFTNDNIPDANVTVINSSNKPTEIGAANTTTWCVVTGDVEYENSIKITGDVHFIISDGANMIIENSEYGIYVSNNTSCLNIYGEDTGTGILTIKYAEIGIRAMNVSIISGNVSINNNTRGISAYNIDIYGGSVTFTDSDCSIFAQSDINIYNGSVSTDGSNGIYSKEGDIIINNGEIDINFTENGIYSGQDITINGGQVTAVGKGGSGIEASMVTINGGTVTATATGNYSGIEASVVTITGGTVTANGEDGISGYQDVIIDGGTIEATGDDYGIFSPNGKITITGGTVTATGGIYTDSQSEITISGGKVTATSKEDGISSFGNIIINGGDITAISTSNDKDRGGIWTFGGDIIITGGNVTATGNNGNGLYSKQDEYGEGGTITLNGGTVKASSYYGTVTIAEGLKYYDGSSLIPDNFNNSDLADKTLQPCITGKKNDNNYWTTFYTGSVGFTIDNAVNACAYTATYGLNSNNQGELTMHELGKVIPKETAVIIVSGSETITMSADASTNVSSVPANNLHGVDVATAQADLKTAYSADALLMLSNKNGNFGFHELASTLTNVPARKAFLPIKDSTGARSLNIVFEDGNTTGIKALNNEERIVNSEDAWFDLQGRKIQMPTQRGLYIHNGKKIVVK